MLRLYPQRVKNLRKIATKSESETTGLAAPNCKKPKNDSSEANFNIKLSTDNVISEDQSEISNSETISDIEFFDDSSKNLKETIEAYSNLTDNQISNPETKEIKNSKKVIKTPKPIIIKNIQDVVIFAATVVQDCDPNFMLQIVGNDLKLIPKDLTTKNKLIDYLKEHRYQFYVVPDTISPLKFVMRGLPKSCKIENIEQEIFNKGFETVKVVQMTSRVDKRALPSF